MPVAGLLAATTERNPMQERAVVADNGRLADNDAGGVVEHDPAPEAGGWVDVDAEGARRLAL